jgi:hypothetical protein
LRHINLQNLLLIASVIIIAFIMLFGNPSPQEFTLTLPQTQPNQLTTQHYIEDYHYLYEIIKTNYPYLTLKNRTHHTNWLDRKTTTIASLQNCTTNTEFLKIITTEITALHNRHSRLLTPTEVQEYHNTFANIPFMAEIFSLQVAEANQQWQVYFLDQYTATNKRYSVEIIYDRGNYIICTRQGSTITPYGTNLTVTHINNIPIHITITTAPTYIDHDPTHDQPYIWAITPTTYPDANFTIRYPNGTETKLTLPTLYGTPRTNYYPAENLITQTYPEYNTAYIYMKTFDPSTTTELAPNINAFLEETRDYDYLIIDIRGNTGGSFNSWITTLVKPLIQDPTPHHYYLAYRNHPYILSFHDNYLNDKTPIQKTSLPNLPFEAQTNDYKIYNWTNIYTPENTINHNAKRILLTDRTIYSAAEGFTNYCKQTGFATIIGTTTGGDGFFVWPMYIVLPNSKLVITATSSMSLDQDGYANEEKRTTPDIIHETNITDHHELIEYTLNLIQRGEIPSKQKNNYLN